MKWKLGAVLVLVHLLLVIAAVGVLAAPALQDETTAAERVADIRSHAPTVSDDFSTAEGGWTEDADDAGNVVGVMEDAYYLRIETPLELPLLVGLGGFTAEDFLMEVDVQPVELHGYSETGLAFRSGLNESYLFFVTSDGEYALIKADSGSLNFVVELTPSPAVELNDEGVIRLGVLADGDQISLLANGEVLTTVDDPDPISGELGFLITASDAGPLEVAFDNFTFWDLDGLQEAQPTATPSSMPTSAPTVTVEAEPTVTPETVATPTASFDDRLAEIRGSAPVFSDDFETWDESWILEGDTAIMSHSGREEVLYLESLEADGAAVLMHPVLAEMALTHYLVEVDMGAASAETKMGTYGLTVGISLDDAAAPFYYFWIADDRYLLVKWSNDKFVDPVPVIPPAQTEALDAVAGVNRLGMLVEGDQITILINGEVVDQAEDADLRPGSIALSAFGEIELVVDNMTVWSLDALETREDTTPVTPQAIRNTTPAYQEDFSTDSGTWTDDSNATTFFHDERAGDLYAEVDADNTLRWVTSGDVGALEPNDFLAEMTTGLIRGDGNYGFVFRLQDRDNYYLFTVWDDSYSLRVLVEGEWNTLIDWTQSDQIETGRRAVNRLGVLARGESITLLINDDVVDQVEDDTFASGTVGVAAGTFENGPIEVTFDDFSLWILGPASPDAATMADRIDDLRATDPVYEETFRRASAGWAAEEDDDAGFFFEGGAYHAQIDADNYTLWYVATDVDDLALTDYLVEVDVWTERQVLEAEYGLVFRYMDDDNFYWFTISDGWFSLYKKGDGEWSALVDWSESDAIQPEAGDRNRLGTWVEGESIVLLINDEVVAEIEDDALSAGAAGVAAGTFDEGGLEVAFDNFAIWTIGAPQPDTDEVTEDDLGEGEEEGSRGGR